MKAGIPAATPARYIAARAGQGIWDMTEDSGEKAVVETQPPRVLTPAAQRALAEAAERRRVAEAAAAANPREINGRGGLDPVRYGDWEVKGLAADF